MVTEEQKRFKSRHLKNLDQIAQQREDHAEREISYLLDMDEGDRLCAEIDGIVEAGKNATRSLSL